jgi:diguanylate cyclase (GGDEF)-like protein/PAS domain S-box-containing protein
MQDVWTLLTAAGGVVYLTLAVSLIRHRAGPGSREIAAAMIAAAVWVAMAVVELRMEPLDDYLLAAKIKYSAVALVPSLLLLFLLRHIDRFRLRPWHEALAFVVPLATIAVVWTNELHEGMWAHPPFAPDQARSVRLPWGSWFWWVHIPHSYLACVLAVALVGFEIARPRRLDRVQASTMLAGILLPLVVNVLFTSGLIDTRFGPTPVAFAATSLLFAWGFLRRDLFRLAPIAYQVVFEHMRDGVLVADRDHRIATHNRAALEITRRPASLVVGYRIEDALPDDERITAALAQDDEATLETHAPDGRLLEICISPIRSRRGRLDGRVVLLRDVTERERTHAALRENEALVRGIVEHSPNGILRLRPRRSQDGDVRDFDCIFANPAAAMQIGRSQSDLVGRPFKGAVHPYTAGLFQAFREVVRTGESCEVDRSIMRGGRETWLRFLAVPAGDDLVVTCVDVTEGKNRELAMEAAAAQDPLTGLLNRRGFESDAPSLLQDALGGARPCALLYADLDRFKEVNDRLGHDVGDLVLCEFAARMQRCTRGPDLMARLGGDEFVLLLLDTGLDGALWVAERLLTMSHQPVRVNGAETDCVPSIGIALHPENGTDLKALLQSADHAMYEAKTRGGGVAVAKRSPVRSVPAEPA